MCQRVGQLVGLIPSPSVLIGPPPPHSMPIGPRLCPNWLAYGLAKSPNHPQLACTRGGNPPKSPFLCSISLQFQRYIVLKKLCCKVCVKMMEWSSSQPLCWVKHYVSPLGQAKQHTQHNDGQWRDHFIITLRLGVGRFNNVFKNYHVQQNTFWSLSRMYDDDDPKVRSYNRVICKVIKTQHQNPEFGHTLGEIRKKNLQKSTFSIQSGMKLRNPSILVVN